MHCGPPNRHRLRLAAAALVLGGCTAHLAAPEGRAPGDVAVINVESTVVRQIDGEHRRGGAFDVSAFEVAPGPHRLTLVFELPARSLGLKSLPAQQGTGVCELSFDARAGRQYYLVARPLGDFNSPRWSGDWEAWVRDPAIASDDDVIARCQAAVPAETPTPLIAVAPPAAPAPGAAPGAIAAPAVAAPAVAAVPTATPLPLPVTRALRVGSWRLPELANASTTDVAAAAVVIRNGFDVLAIAPPLPPQALSAALGSAWAATATADATIFYRRDLVRPCTQPAAPAACLEAIDKPPGSARPLLLQLPPAEAHP